VLIIQAVGIAVKLIIKTESHPVKSESSGETPPPPKESVKLIPFIAISAWKELTF
jgi:hypothetical protein